jgi:hypothetical protein
MKKSLSGIGVFITDKLMEKLSSSMYWNQHRPLYVIFSSHIATKYALLQVNVSLIDELLEDAMDRI